MVFKHFAHQKLRATKQWLSFKPLHEEHDKYKLDENVWSFSRGLTTIISPVADPDLHIRGGGGGVIQTLRQGGGGLQKIFFRPLGLKIKRGQAHRAPHLDPPLFPDQISNPATTMFSNQVEQSPLDLVLPELNIVQADKRILPLFIYVTPIA